MHGQLLNVAKVLIVAEQGRPIARYKLLYPVGKRLMAFSGQCFEASERQYALVAYFLADFIRMN